MSGRVADSPRVPEITSADGKRGLAEMGARESMFPNLKRPPHYAGDVQPIDLIEAHGLGFSEGNIIKYVVRSQRKDGLEDLLKARFYLDRLIALSVAQSEP